MGVLKMSPYVYPGVVGKDGGKKTIANILRVCYAYFLDELDITKEEIQSKVRRRHLVDARRMLGYLLRENTKMTVTSIGSELCVDHATIYHYTRTFIELHNTDYSFRMNYEGLCSKLAQNNLL